MTVPTLHTRIENFVRWIRPDPDRAGPTRKQRDDVKERIKDVLADSCEMTR